MKRFLLILALRKTIVLNSEKEDGEIFYLFIPALQVGSYTSTGEKMEVPIHKHPTFIAIRADVAGDHLHRLANFHLSTQRRSITLMLVITFIYRCVGQLLVRWVVIGMNIFYLG
jgi:hypothetical protein